MDPKHLFRQAALEKLSSPERLDVMMRVTSPAAWIALAALGAILVLVTVWGIFGSLSIKVQGKGMLIQGGTTVQVTSPAQGSVDSVLVRAGDRVSQDQVLMVLNQAQLSQQVDAARASLAAAREAVEVQNPLDRQSERALEREIDGLEDRLATLTELRETGGVTRSQLSQVQGEINAKRQQINGLKEAIRNREREAENAASELALAETQLADQGRVRSPSAGEVSEVKAVRGSILQAGSPVLTLTPIGEIMGYVLVPGGVGKKIQPGHAAQVSPDTIKREEYGFIVGKVRSVSDLPVSQAKLLSVLGDQTLIQELAGRAAPYEILVELEVDEGTPSGLQWTSSEGPPEEILSGTICSANLIIGTKRPIEYVLPIFGIKKS